MISLKGIASLAPLSDFLGGAVDTGLAGEVVLTELVVTEVEGGVGGGGSFPFPLVAVTSLSALLLAEAEGAAAAEMLEGSFDCRGGGGGAAAAAGVAFLVGWLLVGFAV